MKFGQYELLERIAVGGMAEVYRGRVAGVEGFEKLVAIKRVLPEYARDERFISMLLTEARIHSALSHRNIVQIHDLGISEDGEYFIVLEYVEGHDLRAVMEAASALGVQIPDSLALHIADELAQALHFAHELKDADGHPLGIVHRDVSPSNVLLSNSGEVKLSDFGIAKRQRDHSVVGSLKGNLVYMSPEQARKGPLDRRTDVFSLGAVLFEMLTGQKPRAITNEVDGWREVVTGGVRSARELRPDIPEAFEALLARALASDPNDRFPDAALFGAAIRELLRESEAPAGPNDIKELIEVLDPPRHARSPVERSKVIRLGPEFKVPSLVAASAAAASGPGAPPTSALAEARGASEAPAPTAMSTEPASQSPASTPATREPGVPSVARPPLPARARTELGLGRLLRPDLAAASSSSSMPPPPGGAGAASGAGASAGGASGAGATGAGAPTPPPAATGAKTPPLLTPPPPPFLAPPAIVMAPSPAFLPASVNGSNTNGSNGQSHGTAGLATPPLLDAGMPTPPPAARALAAADHDEFPIDVASMPTPPPAASHGLGLPGGAAADRAAMPLSGPVNPGFHSGPMAAAPFMTSGPVGAAAGSRGRLLPILLVLVVVLGGAAAYVHLKVMPLPLLLAWNKPAALHIASEPAGADVMLDGHPVAGQTPTRIEVKRDRADHVVEVSKGGYMPSKRTIRFDRAGDLSESLALAALPPPEAPKTEPAKIDTKTEAAKESADKVKAGPGDDAGDSDKAGKQAKGKKAKSGKQAKGKKAKSGKSGKSGKKAKGKKARSE